MIRSVRAVTLGVLATALLSCQSTTAPTPAPIPARAEVVVLPASGSVEPLAPTTALVAAFPEEETVTATVAYPQAVEETVSWQADTPGSLALLDATGREIYRVDRQSDAFSGRVEAGTYELRITAAPLAPALQVRVAPSGDRWARSVTEFAPPEVTRGEPAPEVTVAELKTLHREWKAAACALVGDLEGRVYWERLQPYSRKRRAYEAAVDAFAHQSNWHSLMMGPERRFVSAMIEEYTHVVVRAADDRAYTPARVCEEQPDY